FSLYFFLPDGPGRRMAEASKPLVVPPRPSGTPPANPETPAMPPPADEVGAPLNAVGAVPPALPAPVDDEGTGPGGKAAARARAPLVGPPGPSCPPPAHPEPPAAPPPADEVGELLNAVGAVPPALPGPVGEEGPEAAGMAAGRVRETFLARPDARDRVPLVDP